MKKKYIFGLFTLLLLWACVSEFNARIALSGSEVLVVEGDIIANSTVEFYFSKSFALEEDTPPAGYDDVEVSLVVIGSDGSRSLPATYLGRGVHQIDVGALNVDVRYGIEFEYDGDMYRSDLLEPLYTPAIDSVSWSQPQKNGAVSICVSTHEEKDGAFRYYLWNYKEDWEIQAAHAATLFYNVSTGQFYEDLSMPYHYCWKKNVGRETLVGTTEALVDNRIVNKILYERKAEDERFSVLYSTMLTQQSITKSAYEYYLDRAKGNQGMGGLFTPQPSKIEGNITCVTNNDKKIIGFTSVAANVEEKRKFVWRHDITRPHIVLDCDRITPDSVKTFLSENKMNYSQYYSLGYRPIDGEQLFNSSGIYYEPSDWSTARCTDCTVGGGTKNKPVFWPNDHQ